MNVRPDSFLLAACRNEVRHVYPGSVREASATELSVGAPRNPAVTVTAIVIHQVPIIALYAGIDDAIAASRKGAGVLAAVAVHAISIVALFRRG